MEEWKDIVGYEKLYQVSNLGNVRKTKSKRLLKHRINRYGYCRVGLSKNSKQTNCGVHRLVAEAFIPNLDNKPEVNHINGDKTNNKIYNLEWVTKSENQLHRIYVLNKMNLSKPVICVETGEEFFSASEAARIKNLDNSLISKVCRGERKTAGGYQWQYKSAQ